MAAPSLRIPSRAIAGLWHPYLSMTCWFSHFESRRTGNDRTVAADNTGNSADAGLIREAEAELYAGDPAGFIQRRGDLAAGARASGQRAAAKAITGLRKPTRSAWVVNRLVRGDPDVASRLAALGDDLREAGRWLDGRRLRELSQARRDLIAALTRQALAGAGQRDEPVSLQEEVAATLSAAVADPQVAAHLATGTLVRPVERAGFGFGPDAGAGGPPPGIRPRPPARTGQADGTGRQRAGRPGPGRPRRDRAEREQAERDRAEPEQAERARAEREWREAITGAEQAVEQAAHAVDAAQSSERAQADAVRDLEQQLEDAQDGLAAAKRRSRVAAAALRDARLALARLRKRAPVSR